MLASVTQIPTMPSTQDATTTNIQLLESTTRWLVCTATTHRQATSIRLSCHSLRRTMCPTSSLESSPIPLMVVKLNRAQTRMNIYSVDPATGNSEEVYDEQSDMWIDEDVATGVKYYDGFFVVMSNRDGRKHLYKYNYLGKLLKQISKGDYDVTTYYGYDQAHKLFYFQSNKGALNRTIRCANDATGEIKELSRVTALTALASTAISPTTSAVSATLPRPTSSCSTASTARRCATCSSTKNMPRNTPRPRFHAASSSLCTTTTATR